MTFHEETSCTLFKRVFCSFLQLYHLGLRPLKGFSSWHSALKGPSSHWYIASGTTERQGHHPGSRTRRRSPRTTINDTNLLVCHKIHFFQRPLILKKLRRELMVELVARPGRRGFDRHWGSLCVMRYSGWGVPATYDVNIIVWTAVAWWGRRWAGLALRVRAGLGGHEHASHGGPRQGPINFVFHPCRTKIVKLAVKQTKNRLHLKHWNWAEKNEILHFHWKD